MRQITSLVLAALLVVGTIPTLGAAGVAQHGTDAQYTTDLGDVRIVAGELEADAGGTVANADGASVDATAANETGATITDYRIADRTLAGDESLDVRMNGTGEGETPVVMSVDGERYDLGTVTADGERVAFRSADPPGLSIECEFGYNSDVGWYIRCEIDVDVATIPDGVHDVGVNGLEPTTVAVGDRARVTDFAAYPANDSVRPDVYAIDVRGSGVGETPLALSVDGERTRLGTVHLGAEGATFQPDDDLDAQSIDVSIHCEGGYNSEDGWWFKCEIEIDFASLSQGTHDVGINDLPATEIDLRGDYGSVGEYTVVDRTINPEEALRLHVEGARGSAGATPLSLRLDGERTRLGTVSVTEQGATFQPDDDLEAQSIDVSIHCEGGYNSEGHDGWWFECEIDITFASISDGTHDVGVNDLEATPVAVDSEEAYVADFGFANATLNPGDVQYADLTVAGESGSVPVQLTVDGDRVHVGTVRVEGGEATFEADESAESAGVIFPPWPPFPGGPCPYAPPCVPLPLDLAAGSHDVGINGLGSTQVAVGENLTVTGYEFAGTNSPVNETEAPPTAVTVFRNNTVRNDSATIEIRATGVGETPLWLTVDGERHPLGTLRATADGASLDVDDDLDAQPIDVEIDCEVGYNSEDGWYVKCRIEIDLFSIVDDDGGDVGVNDLPATTVDVQPAEARMTDYEIRNTTVETGGTLRLETTFEGKSGDVPIVLTVDGREYRAGTVHVEDGRIESVETADAAASPIGFVPCPDLQDDDPLIIVWCATDIPAVAQGTHDVGVNGMEPTTVTVEGGGPLGGVLGGIGDFVGDVLRALGGLLSIPAGPE